MYGFTVPGAIMRQTYTYSEMRDMGFEGSRTTDANYERYMAESERVLDIPVTVKGLGSYDHVQTYDIEVEEAHCFYCDGYLTHNSAGMRQFDSQDELATHAKDNLWQQDESGNWRIDPERDALRMANHTRVFHEKPSLEEVTAAVRKQFYSGEGAVQWAGEAERRAQGEGRYGLNPCGEIIGQNFHCNLAEVHLNQIDPADEQAQADAFKAAGLAVAGLLNHQFTEPRYQQSRLEDPIVGVSFTGLFDFFVLAFGVEWLRWWQAGRPDTVSGLAFKAKEQAYLSRWQEIVHQTVWDYCDRHGIKRPNRCTTVQPAGTKSLLSGASPGWHPPKAQRFIRRITFRKDDPVALACIDYGYAVVPSQSDKDENGHLLSDPFDPRCTEWLVELPVEVAWANLPGADEIAIEQFSALAQFDFYMQVQKYYTAHNTSATIELREAEIEPLAERIHQAIQTDEGYISAALLARFDDLQTFPRLPFEPIDKATYEAQVRQVLARRTTENFHAALERYDAGELVEAGPAGCDSDKCLLPEKQPE
jgi:ribonucleotide reductase class II